MTRSPLAKRWCFTINNFTQPEQEAVQSLEGNPLVQYVVAEMEHLDQGTPHIQGYIHLTQKKRRSQVEGMLGGRAHVEVAQGSEADNIKYCTKEDLVIIQWGNAVGATRAGAIKTDEDAAAMLKDIREMKEDDFEAAHPKYYLLHKQTYRDFHHEHMVKSQKTWDGSLKKKNLWIWGPPGTGKSRCSRIGVPFYQIFAKAFNKWWNGYDICNTKRVIIDDWPSAEEGGQILCQHLKIWADRYPFTAETKGGHIAVEPNYQLIITSNYPISRCFKTDEDIQAIRRRFKEIKWEADKEVQDPYECDEIDDSIDEDEE